MTRNNKHNKQNNNSSTTPRRSRPSTPILPGENNDNDNNNQQSRRAEVLQNLQTRVSGLRVPNYIEIVDEQDREPTSLSQNTIGHEPMNQDEGLSINNI
jgi:hypothetical protein